MVSICILNWNCLETLKSIVDILQEVSIKNQIIIYDQNSSDGSVEFLKSLNNIEVIFSPLNTGSSVARNEMINRCIYEHIILLDADIIPIKNSFESMYNFMIKNPNFAYIGYDYKNYTRSLDFSTKYENGINRSDICLQHSNDKKQLCLNKKGKYYSYKIALTQYGIFKKSCLLDCPFPEFYPFNEQGWGAEDDIVGIAIIDNNLGDAGVIKNRCYYHEAHSSKRMLGKNIFYKKYVERYSCLKYFDNFLSPSQKIQSLKNKKLFSTKLNLNKYFYKKENLGDIATDYVFSKLFPFFEFEKDPSENLFMFGGTIFNHTPNAEKEFNSKYKNILAFGVGLSNEKELLEGLKYNTGKKVKIIPRGYKSMDVFNQNKIKCEEPLGDVLQLFLGIDFCQKPSLDFNMYIKDPYSPDLLSVPDNSHIYRVSRSNKKKYENIPFLKLESFLKRIKKYKKVYSSQVHPFFISAVVGRSAYLFPKDWRAEDLCYFNNIKNSNGEFDLDHNKCLSLREEIYDNIRDFIDQLMVELKRYSF